MSGKRCCPSWTKSGQRCLRSRSGQTTTTTIATTTTTTTNDYIRFGLIHLSNAHEVQIFVWPLCYFGPKSNVGLSEAILAHLGATLDYSWQRSWVILGHLWGTLPGLVPSFSDLNHLVRYRVLSWLVSHRPVSELCLTLSLRRLRYVVAVFVFVDFLVRFLS